MHKIFELITEIIGWIQIALSPTLFGLIIGYIIYYNFDSIYGLIVGILVALIGLIFGIVLATKKFKTSGTIHFLSRVSASPELDNLEKSEKENENKNCR
ncbi:hypothetical protein ACFS5J_00240 [Flavobacterium chuncheonense]|uniref:Uncharacterized protein n=1 Tax=Flavobacterium chuncheonense TaxID=2026653 RepID=A0ABW5YHL0_9FLAO